MAKKKPTAKPNNDGKTHRVGNGEKTAPAKTK